MKKTNLKLKKLKKKMIIASNSKNSLNKYNNKEKISSFNEKSLEINDYKKILTSIISDGLYRAYERFKKWNKS